MITSAEIEQYYRDRAVLVTGGLGHIGSNLAIRLAELGARVTVIDNSVPGCGANLYNLHPIAGGFTLIGTDIGCAGEFPDALAESSVIFNLAGELSHSHSMLFPERDLAINTQSQLGFLLAVARHTPGRRVVFTSTRQIYGTPEYLPVDERHPVAPPDFNGVHKNCAGNYHLMLGRLGRIDPIVLRLTNVIGPRMAIGLPCQGFLGDFTRLALTAQPITVFGDGQQLRDPIYVDDAVDALLRAGAVTAPKRRVFNVGSSEPLPVVKIAEHFRRIAQLPPVHLTPFPPARAGIDIGGYVTDAQACQDELGWRAHWPFRAAAEQTLHYYSGRLEHYLPDGTAHCPLGHLKG